MKVSGFRQYLFLFFWFVTCSSLFAELEYHEITVEGRGPTLGAAVNEALIEAVGQVNGKTVDATSMLSSAEVSTAKGDNVDYYLSESFRRSVASATKGVVASYEIIDSHEETGRWYVQVRAQIGKYKLTEKSQRKRIAVVPLRVTFGRFAFDQQARDNRDAARILADNISARLTQSRRFAVLDRNYQNDTVGEKQLILSDDVRPEEVARLGEQLVADYLVVGTLEGVALKEKNHTFPSGKVVRNYGGTVSVSFRVIEVATRQVALAEVLNVPIYSKTQDVNIPEVLMPVADQVSEEILSAIYPILVVQVRDDQVVLGQGGDGIKVGDRFRVFRYGERMIDPYNGEFLGREEIYCAEVEVERVLPRQSYARIVNSEVDLAPAFAPKTLVCRSAGEQEVKKQKQAKRNASNESLDSDW
jgi:curli biogenesis system outer membrane secretion channel CsgG